MWVGGTEPDPLLDVVYPNGVISGVVLLPPGTEQDYVLAPSFYPIHTQDIDDEDDNWPKGKTHQVNWSIFFHDLVIAEDSTGESAAVHAGGQFQVPTTAHEYGHAWEGWPDLYDYDVFGAPGSVINCPVGRWDIMATGGLVHPIAPIKAGPCTEWVDPVDLTTVLTPGVSTVLTLPPAEKARNNSYFYLENYAMNQGQQRVERYYLWSAAGVPPSGPTFDTPGFPGFGEGNYVNGGMPGEGMLMLHTDFGADEKGLPQQQRFGGHFLYVIVQADGLHELEGGINVDPACGDDGDPWPGSSENTYFDYGTNPQSRWYANNSFTGLQITNIVPDDQGAVSLTLNWVPTSIPSLLFIDPPGGSSVNSPNGDKVYEVRVRASDLYGGSRIRFFYTNDETDLTIDPDGANYIGAITKQTTGTNQLSLDWVINDVLDDRYYIFAELIPGPGLDHDENAFTTPRAGRENVGNGTLSVSATTGVNANEVVATDFIGVFVNDEPDKFYAIPEGGGFFNFAGAGVQAGDQLVTGPLPGSSQQIMRTITGVTGTILTVSAPVMPDGELGDTEGVTDWIITHGGRNSRLETWTIECVNTTGTDWTVYSSLTQPKPASDDPNQDPYPHATTGQLYTSLGGEVTFTVNAGTTAFGLGDMFVFTTTGITDISAGVTVLNGLISEGPVAIVTATPLSGPAPHKVEFDGRDSFDPNGVALVFEWDFGDGQNATGPSLVNHTYLQAGTFTAVLRVTNPQNNLFGEEVVDIVVINNTPHAVVKAQPISGRKPLVVHFDATDSSDTETDDDELVYQWNFGDGQTANGAGDPGFWTVDHTYNPASSTPVTYIAKLTVRDADGGFDTDTISILVGNTLPIPSVYHSALTGSTPLTVKFNASQSYDADGDALTVEWEWGDGSAKQTLGAKTGDDGAGNVSHTFTLPSGQTKKTYQVTAVIKDARGGSVNWPGVKVEVAEAQAGASQPQAVFTVTPNPPLLNQAFQVDGHLSYDRPSGDPAAKVTSYTWNFGDGSAAVTKTSPLATHTYTSAGSYTISLTVADNETPPNTHTDTKPVTVLAEGEEPDEDEDNAAPVARISLDRNTGYAGVTRFTFNGELSSDEDGDALTYRWFFGDGQTATGAEVSHVYAKSGEYTARLMVSDTQNASNIDTQLITIAEVGDNHTPVAVIATGKRSGTAPVSLTFNGSISYDPDGDPLTYAWTFELDGEVVATAAEALVSVRFEQPGTYAVALKVSDDRGGTDDAGPEVVVIAERTTQPDDNDNDNEPTDPDEGQEIPDSANQRPGGTRMCGIGMVMSFFGSLLGLAGLAGARRRRWL